VTTRLHAYTIKRTLRIATAVILALSATVGIAILFGHVFTVRNIVVDAPGMSITLDNSKMSYNLFFLPTDKLRAELMDRYTLLEDVRFEKRLPATLVIHLTKRAPAVLLLSGRTWYALDKNGNVVDIGTNVPGLPVFRMEAGAFGLGSTVRDPNVAAALSFYTALAGKIPITEFTVAGDGSIRAVYGNTNIFIPQAGDQKAKADTLQIIIEGFRIKGTLPTVIDLRFDKTIITN